MVVTGAASGLGFAMAEVLADCGARVTLADIAEERLAPSTEALRSRGLDARSFVVDVSDEDAVQGLFDDVVEAQGGVDVVFANAGLASVPGFRFEDGQTFDTIQRADWDRVLGVNLTGVMHTMRSAARVMKAQGSGRIVVTASNAGIRLEPMACYGYHASKAAVIHLVRAAALELASDGILVNAICPGPFYGTLIGGGVTENPDRGDEEDVGDADPTRSHGAPGRTEGHRPAPRLACLELHHRRCARRGRRLPRPGLTRLVQIEGASDDAARAGRHGDPPARVVRLHRPGPPTAAGVQYQRIPRSWAGVRELTRSSARCCAGRIRALPGTPSAFS